MRLVKLILAIGAVAVVAFAAAQFGNPEDPRNSSALTTRSFEQEFRPPDQVMQVLRKSCFDCHSQHTRWPWYSHLPVVRRQIEKHVTQGRLHLNFSHWDSDADISEQEDLIAGICDTAKMRLMPLPAYLIAHPFARPSDEDVRALCDWSKAALTSPRT